MKLFLRYLHQRRGLIGAFFLFGALFCVSFWLYRLPVAAILYPMTLCALLGACFLLWDFHKIRERHDCLRRLQNLTAAMIGDLPDAPTIECADYQAILRALIKEASEQEATAANQYQDMIDYYTVWAHQIKTPITSMRLSLEREDTALSRKLKSDLFQIEQYVEMVLAFLRLGSSSSDYVFRACSVDSIIEQAVTKFASEFIARKIRLDYVPTGQTVVTDEKWLSFVLEQILSNALKYTRTGSIKISMREPKLLCIQDTGIGIAPSDLPRVFEKGYTGCNGRTDQRASGIGLYLCKQICSRLGVEIRITSELDRGTTVTLNLEQYKL